MGFINFLRGAVDVASGAHAAGQQAEMRNLPLLVQLQQMQRQSELAAEDRALRERVADAQMRNIDSEITAREHPPTTFGTVTSDNGIYSRDSRTGALTPLKDPVTGKPLQPFHQAPSQFTFPTGLDANGNPVVLRANTKTGSVEPTDVQRPQPGTSSSGSQTSVADMQQRLKEIEQHAQNVATGKLHITRAMQTREGLGYGIANESAGGKGVPLTQSIAAGAMDMMGMGQGPDYEEYQALMNSTRAFGDDAAKVFKGRQNEDAVRREIALSQLTPDDYQNPQTVAQKLSRMQHIVDLARQTMPGGSPLPAHSPAPSAQPSGGGAFHDLIPKRP